LQNVIVIDRAARALLCQKYRCNRWITMQH